MLLQLTEGLILGGVMLLVLLGELLLRLNELLLLVGLMQVDRKSKMRILLANKTNR